MGYVCVRCAWRSPEITVIRVSYNLTPSLYSLPSPTLEEVSAPWGLRSSNVWNSLDACREKQQAANPEKELLFGIENALVKLTHDHLQALPTSLWFESWLLGLVTPPMEMTGRTSAGVPCLEFPPLKTFSNCLGNVCHVPWIRPSHSSCHSLLSRCPLAKSLLTAICTLLQAPVPWGPSLVTVVSIVMMLLVLGLHWDQGSLPRACPSLNDPPSVWVHMSEACPQPDQMWSSHTSLTFPLMSTLLSRATPPELQDQPQLLIYAQSFLSFLKSSSSLLQAVSGGLAQTISNKYARILFKALLLKEGECEGRGECCPWEKRN